MTAITNLISALAWPFVVALGIWYFRNELKTALKRITEIGLSGAKFGPPPEQQITTSPSTVTAQELPAPKSAPEVDSGIRANRRTAGLATGNVLFRS
jgi:hypothetical protein